MKKSVLLILVDGLRPDAIENCDHPYLKDLCKKSCWSWNASTVMPSVTLPCHTSLFLSVDPIRHGIITNTWVPQVRPIKSICDAAYQAGRKCAMFYNWEELRDLNRPESLDANYYCRAVGRAPGTADLAVTKQAISYIRDEKPDFVFLYLGETDEVGHSKGWMSPEYLNAVSTASACIEEIMNSLPDGWNTIITADHGGHDRTHGTELPEDMTIPLYLAGPAFIPGKLADTPNIKDIAPTIAALLDFQPPAEWEGRCLFG